MLSSSSPARRRIPRLPSADVWVYWEGLSCHDVSRVRDLSASGLFVETQFRKSKGDLLHIHFLVQEGSIRLDAQVRHASHGHGLGLKIQSVAAKDVPLFDALLRRVGSFTRIPAG
jgi:hypothetical protein